MTFEEWMKTDEVQHMLNNAFYHELAKKAWEAGYNEGYLQSGSDACDD